MSANAGRKYNPDPNVQISIKLPESLFRGIDAVRGAQSRQGWIREAIASALYYEAKETA